MWTIRPQRHVLRPPLPRLLLSMKVVKHRSLIFVSLILSLQSFALFSQGLHLDWARTFRLDPSKTNQSWKILPAADGVIVAGTSAGLAGDLDYVVIKYAANGNQAWTYRHDSFEGAND